MEWDASFPRRAARDLKEFIGAEVEQDEFIAFEEAKAIGARLDSLAADLERDFSEEVCLIFLAEAGGVTGIVDHAGENVGVVGKMNAASVADLNRRRLAAEEDGFGKSFGFMSEALRTTSLSSAGAAKAERPSQSKGATSNRIETAKAEKRGSIGSP